MMTPFLAKRARPGGFAVGAAWTVLVIAATAVVSPIIAFVPAPGGSLVRTNQQSRFRAIRTDAGVISNVPGYRVEFDMSIDYRGNGPAESGSVTLTIETDAGVIKVVEIDLPKKTWRATGSARSGTPTGTTGVFDRDAALALLASAGINTGKPYVLLEAEILSDSVDLLATSSQLALTRGLGMMPQQLQVAPSPIPPQWVPNVLDCSGGGQSYMDNQNFTSSFSFSDASSSGTNASFDGTIEFAVVSGSLEITARVRDVEGGTGELRYNPVTGDTEITGLAGTVQVNAPDARAAFTEFATALSLGTRGTDFIDDLSDLTATIVKDPLHFVQVVQKPNYISPLIVTQDGEPDGGFYGGGASTSTGPVGGLRGASIVLLGGYAAMGMAYAYGIFFIWRRRRAMQRIAMAEHAPFQTAASSA